jgi:methylenetetrahydrofolate reductase (NADPH)
MVQRLDPLFIDVTWGAGGSTREKSLSVASYAQRYCGVDVLLHLTCTDMTRDDISSVMDQAKTCGIQNILVLRGDPAKGRGKWEPIRNGFQYAIEMVQFIRERYGSHFCIAVAGHPEGHADSQSLDSDIHYLKGKIDAGADFILTQFFYDVDVFKEYVTKCREAGIECPIIPGIMPIQSYSSFIRMTEFCGTKVPQSVLDLLLPVKEDDEAVKEIGCTVATQMCEDILNANLRGVDGVHFYTLNLERSVNVILRQLRAAHPGLIEREEKSGQEKSKDTGVTTGDAVVDDEILISRERQFPWRPSTMENRSKEEQVRPINWANRPKSYVMRTEDWDEFPNGRWGDSSSPAFGELSDLVHFYNFSLGSEEDHRAMLGERPMMTSDIYETFARYVEGAIPFLPWCESSLHSESFSIQKELAVLNRKGFLSINSQPSLNGVKSDNPQFGWGGVGGYVYQKAYCEFFTSPDNLKTLTAMVKDTPSMQLHAVNLERDEVKIGVKEGGVTALTWGT